jgi:hypothetical protein
MVPENAMITAILKAIKLLFVKSSTASVLHTIQLLCQLCPKRIYGLNNLELKIRTRSGEVRYKQSRDLGIPSLHEILYEMQSLIYLNVNLKPYIKTSVPLFRLACCVTYTVLGPLGCIRG